MWIEKKKHLVAYIPKYLGLMLQVDTRMVCMNKYTRCRQIYHPAHLNISRCTAHDFYSWIYINQNHLIGEIKRKRKRKPMMIFGGREKMELFSGLFPKGHHRCHGQVYFFLLFMKEPRMASHKSLLHALSQKLVLSLVLCFFKDTKDKNSIMHHGLLP